MLALAAAIAATIWCLLAPLYTVKSSESPIEGHATLLEVNGARAIPALALPVLLAGIPVLFPKRGLCGAAALMLLAFSILGGFSVGLFYLPSAALLLTAFLLTPVHQA